jgi:oligopeptide/dipeptide ABC transporter ATP-binding protein
MLRLEDPTEGEVVFEGRDLSKTSKKEMVELRKRIQVIFQDPYSSLNPRKIIETIVGEPFLIHKMGTKKEASDKVSQLLDKVGIRPQYASRYPHEFSGGQRQRIGIARSLILHPKFIVCDEPVSALDVSVQAQVINLLEDLQDEFGLTYLFISHDLSVVEHISDRVAVMYLGRIIELGNTREVCAEPLHPYTQALMSASPMVDPHVKREKIILTGDVPSPINPPPGCHFHLRCHKVMDICREKAPKVKEISPGRKVCCHLYD